MRIPGMHYQDDIWGVIKKALGEAALIAFDKVGVANLQNDNAWHIYTKPLCDALLIALAPHDNKLRRRLNRHDVDAYTLAQDLIVLLSAFIEQVSPPEPPTPRPKYMVRMSRQLAAIPPPASDEKLRKVAHNVFTELRDAVDADGLRAACGEEITLNRLQLLRLVDAQRQAMFRFLTTWQSHAELASLVVGVTLNKALVSLPIRRALRDRVCPALWLMNWDKNYVHIQTTLHALQDEKQRARLKPPLSGKSPKHFTFTEEAIDSLLKQLTAYESMVCTLGGTGCNASWLEPVRGAVRDDDPRQWQIIDPPSAQEVVTDDDDDDTQDEPASLWDEVTSLAEGELEPFSEDDADLSPGKWMDEDPDDDALDRQDAAMNALTYRCLRQFPLPIQVGVLRHLAPGAGQAWKSQLMATVADMRVFETYGWEASFKSLSDANLASVCGVSGINVKDFKDTVLQAVKAFAQCASERLAQEHRARNPNP